MGLVEYFLRAPKDLEAARGGLKIMVVIWVFSLVGIAAAFGAMLLGVDTLGLMIDMIILSGLAGVGIGVSREAYYRLGGERP